MAWPDRRKIPEWIIAESLRRRSAGVGDETLFAWMMSEGYDEMESLSMLAEALGWTGAGLRSQPFWPRLSPDQKLGLIKAGRGSDSLKPVSIMRVTKRAVIEKGKPGRRPDGGKDV